MSSANIQVFRGYLAGVEDRRHGTDVHARDDDPAFQEGYTAGRNGHPLIAGMSQHEPRVGSVDRPEAGRAAGS
jgi:hypothetical protein